MNNYARNQVLDMVEYPYLVYSNYLDAFFPCRVLASNNSMAYIEAAYRGQVIKMRVPVSIIYHQVKPKQDEPPSRRGL
jgi:hypothetical protein